MLYLNPLEELLNWFFNVIIELDRLRLDIDKQMRKLCTKPNTPGWNISISVQTNVQIKVQLFQSFCANWYWRAMKHQELLVIVIIHCVYAYMVYCHMDELFITKRLVYLYFKNASHCNSLYWLLFTQLWDKNTVAEYVKCLTRYMYTIIIV